MGHVNRTGGQSCRVAITLRAILCTLLWATWSSADSFDSYYGEDDFDIFNCVISDNAGGNYLVGGLGKSKERSVGWIVRVDGHGAKILDRSIEPTRSIERRPRTSVLMDALVLPNGDLIAAGRTKLPSLKDAVTSLLRGENAVTVISASKGRQASHERAAIGGGVFSMSLAELIVDADRKADANGDRVLELSEVYGALKRRVVRITSGAQTPWIARNQMVGEIPLF